MNRFRDNLSKIEDEIGGLKNDIIRLNTHINHKLEMIISQKAKIKSEIESIIGKIDKITDKIPYLSKKLTTFSEIQKNSKKLIISDSCKNSLIFILKVIKIIDSNDFKTYEFLNELNLLNLSELNDKILRKSLKIFDEILKEYEVKFSINVKKFGYPKLEKSCFRSDERYIGFQNSSFEMINLFTIKSKIANDDLYVNEIANLFFYPIKTHYKFHFHGSKPTNNIFKPEWGLNQLILWFDVNIEIFYDILTKGNFIIDLNGIQLRFFRFFQDVVYDNYTSRKAEFICDSTILINLIDKIYIFYQSIKKRCTSIVYDFSYCHVLDLINPNTNRDIFDIWRCFQLNLIKKEIENFFCSEIFEAQKSTSIFDSHFSHFSFKIIGLLNTIIEKLIISDLFDLKIALLEIVTKIFQYMMDEFFSKYRNPLKYETEEVKIVLSYINTIYENIKWFNTLKTESWYMFLESNRISLENVIQGLFGRMIELINIFISDLMDDLNSYIEKNMPSIDEKFSHLIINSYIHEFISIINSKNFGSIKIIIIKTWKKKLESAKDFPLREYILDYLICESQDITDGISVDTMADTLFQIY